MFPTRTTSPDTVPSAVPEPSSVTVPLYRLPGTSTPEDDGVVPFAVPEPSSITTPLYRLPGTSSGKSEHDFVPSAGPEPSTIKVPLHRLPATAEEGDFAPSTAPEPSSVIVPLISLSPTSAEGGDSFAQELITVPSAAPEPSQITTPLYRLPASPSTTSTEDDDFIRSLVPGPSSVTVPLSKSTEITSVEGNKSPQPTSGVSINNPDLQKLAASTTAAFEIIGPWSLRGSELQSAALKGIVAQSKVYANAIKSSVHAAQSTHSLAQEAIDFADKRLNQEFSSTKADQFYYLQRMAAAARQGMEKTGKVLREFKGVSGTVSMLIFQAMAELDKLDKAIPDLEIFRGSLEVYISWWSDVDIRQVSTSQRSDISITSYAPERLKDLKKHWTRLMDDYRDYAHQIEILQGRHPELTGDS